MWDSLEYMSLVAHTALPRRSVCTPLIWSSLQLRGLVFIELGTIWLLGPALNPK